MILNEGDIVVVSCISIPLCYHVGILVSENGQPFVYHNTPTAKNEAGGNIVAQSFDDFMKNRKVLKTIATDNNPDLVRQHAFENRFKQWDALAYNCEDYVNEVKYCERKSTLRNIALLVAVAAIASRWG